MPLHMQAGQSTLQNAIARFLAAHRQAPTRAKAPVRFSSYSQIARTLKQPQFSNAYGGLDRRVSTALGQSGVSMTGVLPAAALAADAVASASTGTNTQVSGVDEADLVKTDGTILYTVSHGRLAVVRAAAQSDSGAATPLELLSLVEFGDDGFVPTELHLYGHFLVVVGTSYDYSFLDYPVLVDPVVTTAKVARLMPIWGGTARVVLRVYDVTDPAAVSLVRTLQIEGTQVASRRIGQHLYVLARAYPFLDAALDTRRNTAAAGLVPRVGDSLAGDGFRDLLPTEVAALPGCYEASYLVIAALDLGSATGEFRPQAFLGAGNVVYVSESNLYVASSSWFWRPLLAMTAAGTAAETAAETVTLFRFRLSGTAVQFAAQGAVPGRVLNSFSMDERRGVFRIATTAYPTLWTDAGETSGVYTLDLGLNRLGEVTGLAPGERIYAARFLGERCYLVTFKTIDPLFVIDLANPARPQVLGELKVPGYSSYLHPFDSTHLIGFGKDVQVVQTPWSGADGVPLEQGLKVSLFDVSDVSKPQELYSERIGVRGSSSEALYDHHAFLFDPARGLLAFPCTIREFVDPADPADPWWWGDFVFQGLVAYGLSVDSGFTRLGAVTHVDAEPVEAWDAPWDRTVRRGLVVGGLLHSVSEGMIKANDLTTLEERSSLELPWEDVASPDPLVYWLLTDVSVSSGADGSSGDLGPAGQTDGASAEPPAVTPAAAMGELFRGFLEATR
jgi:uncharacterized secreted protein with C-terminal beta-propeller domain